MQNLASLIGDLKKCSQQRMVQVLLQVTCKETATTLQLLHQHAAFSQHASTASFPVHQVILQVLEHIEKMNQVQLFCCITQMLLSSTAFACAFQAEMNAHQQDTMNKQVPSGPTESQKIATKKYANPDRSQVALLQVAQVKFSEKEICTLSMDELAEQFTTHELSAFCLHLKLPYVCLDKAMLAKRLYYKYHGGVPLQIVELQNKYEKMNIEKLRQLASRNGKRKVLAEHLAHLEYEKSKL